MALVLGRRPQLVALICGTLLCIYLYANYSLMSGGAVHSAGSKCDSRWSNRDETGISELVADSLKSTEDRDPVELKCRMYQEFRRLDFLHPALRHRLCKDAEAYKRYPDGYPLCQLQIPFPSDLLDIVKRGSEVVQLKDMAKVPMFAYDSTDSISMAIRTTGSWESEMVHSTLRFALRVPQTTFLDIGSNIGVYSIQAAKLGLPVVSLDANIRNLLRLHLSLNASSLSSTLVWNFITTGQQLKYLSFIADCNVGGAGKDRADLPDTVPVMPVKSERLTSLIKTKNIVMKMDVQGGEADFLSMSGRMFSDFNVVAVQMEWWNSLIAEKDAVAMTTFFVDRGYKVWRTVDSLSLDPSQWRTWGNCDVMWVHEDFVKMM